MTDNNRDTPQLADLVRAGDQQQAAEAINEFIYMAKDISNAYLVKTQSGDVLVNTGFMANADRNKALFEPVRSGPLQAILLTQAHADHFGGVPTFREDDTRIIAQQQFGDTANYFRLLMPYLKRRSGKLWAGVIKGRDHPVPDIQPDICFDQHYAAEFGGRRFELIATPGGESPDAMIVWLPDERVVFTGNLFGPVFMSVPNLNTIRGDKPRSVNRFLDSLYTVRELGADLMITGHGEPIRGTDRIQTELTTLYDAVSFIRDQTIEGMNAGVDVHTLMRDIQLPEDLQLLESHGKVSWAVKSIWHEFSGWFMYDTTTALYDVPRSSIDSDLAELTGGAGPLAKRAQDKLTAGKPLEALHLLDIALNAEPGHRDSLTVKKAALQTLLKASGGGNLSEVMWLKSEIDAIALD